MAIGKLVAKHPVCDPDYTTHRSVFFNFHITNKYLYFYLTSQQDF